MYVKNICLLSLDPHRLKVVLCSVIYPCSAIRPPLSKSEAASVVVSRSAALISRIPSSSLQFCGSRFGLLVGFVGYEYECDNGHRFLDAAPDRRVQPTGSGYPKGTANPLLNTDMPMFVRCAHLKCARHDRYAQLGRLHVVTSKQPLRYLLEPRIQLRAAGANSAPLVCTANPEQIWLKPNGHYSIQLPRMFAHENKAIILPVDNPTMRVCS